jgi:hypothetical protein
MTVPVTPVVPAVDETVTPPVAAAPPVEAAPVPPAAPAPVVTPATLPAAPAAPAAPVADDEAVFTAADLERAIQQRVGRLNKSHEKELAAVKAGATTPDVTALTAELAAARTALALGTAEYAVRFEAVAAGVAPAQTDAIVKLADLTDAVTADGGLDPVKVTAAVKTVLDQYPGLIGTPGTPAPTGAPAGAGPSSADPQKPTADTLMDAVISRFAQ